MVNEDLLKTRLEHIRTIAKYNGWQESEHREDIHRVCFSRNGNLINLFYSKMSVVIYRYSPEHGIDRIYFRRVTKENLGKIFRNPWKKI